MGAKHLLVQGGMKELTPEQVSELDNAALIFLCDAAHDLECQTDTAIYHISAGKGWADINTALAGARG